MLGWARRVRRSVVMRFGLVLVALAGGAGLALLVGASAFGDTVCGTTGDVSDCAQWGVDGNATRLAVENTGTQTISSFTFTLPAGTTVTGVAGTTSCTWASNQITCTMPIAPGQTFFADILYPQGGMPAVGSTGTLTPSDAGGTPQPGQNVSLQAATVCGTTPCTISSSSTNTNTSSGTPTTQTCQARLKVSKHLGFSKGLIKQHRDLYVTFKNSEILEYVIVVKNDSGCPATGVVVTDALPHDFDCHGGVWHLSERMPHLNDLACKGEGRDVRVDVGALGPDQAVIVELRGRFPAERTTTNVAHATAANAPGAHSDHVHVDVVSEKQFLADRGKVQTP
jgi:hypothetical protein